MSGAVAKMCDERIAIPLRGAIESLNASVAAGVILFEAARQRALHRR
jgi:tRNA G18 (ribose-2'-O)-methylase SpoU